MSSGKATQTSTKYYLFNMYTGRQCDDTYYDTFDDACRAANSLPGIWEVHTTANARKKR